MNRHLGRIFFLFLFANMRSSNRNISRDLTLAKPLKGVYPRGVMVNALNCRILVSEFEL